MNLEQASTMSQLSVPTPVKTLKDTLSSTQVAFRILARCEAGGYPYKHFPVNKSGAKAWAKKFLTSKEFKLMRINLNAAASPHNPRDPKRVKFYRNILAARIGKPPDFDPIVVDVNRRKEGRTHLGYIPDVIVTDGKHRKASMLAAGITHYWAWVGVKAVKKMKPKDVKAAADVQLYLPPVDGTKIASQYEMKCSMTPAIPVRQDTGSGGSRPKDALHGGKKKVKAADCQACGAVSTGSLEPGAASDDKVPPDGSDAGSSVEASDRRQWNKDKPNLYPGGLKPGNADQFGLSKPAAYSNNIGPRVPNRGASKSELARGMEVKAGGPGSGRRSTGRVGPIPTSEQPSDDSYGPRGNKDESSDENVPAYPAYGPRGDKAMTAFGHTDGDHEKPTFRVESGKKVDKIWNKKKKKMKADVGLANNMEAGGPGSGRKPSQVLSDRGWKKSGTDNVGSHHYVTYTHSDYPDHEISVTNRGYTWIHDTPKSSRQDNGGDSLEKHLAKGGK